MQLVRWYGQLHSHFLQSGAEYIQYFLLGPPFLAEVFVLILSHSPLNLGSGSNVIYIYSYFSLDLQLGYCNSMILGIVTDVQQLYFTISPPRYPHLLWRQLMDLWSICSQYGIHQNFSLCLPSLLSLFHGQHCSQLFLLRAATDFLIHIGIEMCGVVCSLEVLKVKSIMNQSGVEQQSSSIYGLSLK